MRGRVRTLSNTPEVLATLHDATIPRCHVLGRADDGERNCFLEDTGVLGGSLVIRVHGGLVDTDTLRLDDVPNLYMTRLRIWVLCGLQSSHLLLEQCKVVLCESISLRNDGDEVDPRSQALHDLNVQRLQAEGASGEPHDSFKNGSTYVWPVGRMKYKHACTRMSLFSARSGCCSCLM